MGIVGTCDLIQSTIAAAWRLDPDLGGASPPVLIYAPRVRDLPDSRGTQRILDVSFSPEVDFVELASQSPERSRSRAVLVVTAIVDAPMPAMPADGSDPAAEILNGQLSPFAALVEGKIDRILQDLRSETKHPVPACHVEESSFSTYRPIVDDEGNRLRAAGEFRYEVQLLTEADTEDLADLAGADVEYLMPDHPEPPAAEDKIDL